MESVEIWLWIIAGLFIVGIIIVSGFKIINTYLTTELNNIIEEDLNRITNSIDKLCVSPKYSRETLEIRIPDTIRLMYISDGETDGKGNIFCFEFNNKKYCKKTDCTASMDTYQKQINKNWFNAIIRKKKFIPFKIKLEKKEGIVITYKELI